jgi:hypothetical protein
MWCRSQCRRGGVRRMLPRDSDRLVEGWPERRPALAVLTQAIGSCELSGASAVSSVEVPGTALSALATGPRQQTVRRCSVTIRLSFGHARACGISAAASRASSGAREPSPRIGSRRPPIDGEALTVSVWSKIGTPIEATPGVTSSSEIA